MKKIIIHDIAAHSFVLQLSNKLSTDGSFEVIHLTSYFFKSPNQDSLSKHDISSRLQLVRIDLPWKYSKTNLVKRFLIDLIYGKKIINVLKKYKPDYFINCVSPIDSSKQIQKFCMKNDIKFISWLQDIYSLAIQSVLSKNYSIIGKIIGRHYENVEKNILLNSSHVISISADFLTILSKWGVKREHISVIPNWANLDKIPEKKKINSWSVNNKLNDKFCFLYSGTLGFKHNPQLLISLAEKFKDNNNIAIVVISEGQGAEWLKHQITKENIKNLLLLNYQQSSIFPEVLGTADVLISILEEDAAKYSVPSKVLSYICAGRSLLLSVPKNNLASKIVLKNNLGLVAEPNNSISFLNHSERLYQDSKLREELSNNCIAYSIKNFDINKITSKFLRVLEKNISN